MNIPHLFIQSSVNRHLYGFQFSVIMNKKGCKWSSTNLYVDISYFFEWTRVESMVIVQVCISHYKKQFFKVVVLFCTPAVMLDFNYSTSSPKFSVFRLLDLSHFSGYEEVSYCDLISISLMTDDVEYLFICLLVFIYFLLQSVFSSILCVLKLGCFLF